MFSSSPSSATKVVCYFENWATYRAGNGKFDVEDIDPKLCTHLIYSFVGISADGQVKLLEPGRDEDRIRRFNNLKRQNGNLKTMVAIGGANGDSAAFSQVVGDNRLRSVFANNVIAFLKKYGFDGFDLDWEYPTDKVSYQLTILSLLLLLFLLLVLFLLLLSLSSS
ncbi:hypothetical protein C0J52_01401 [Blattella germanica]|nr:hypothetical protein C0J52_01401 [Blattella germanica]